MYKQQKTQKKLLKICCYNFWATMCCSYTPITETSSFDSTPWSCFVCEHVPVDSSDQGVDGLGGANAKLNFT